jgi:hypothetical protein
MLGERPNRSPCLYNGRNAGNKSEDQDDQSNPESIPLLGIAAISPELAPADGGRAIDFLIDLQKTVSPVHELAKVQSAGPVKWSHVVEVLAVPHQQVLSSWVPVREEQVE